jgi:hypothetical protein
MVRVHIPLTYRITIWYIAIAVTLSLIAEVVRMVNQ